MDEAGGSLPYLGQNVGIWEQGPAGGRTGGAPVRSSSWGTELRGLTRP